jgi:hypothetical protein
VVLHPVVQGAPGEKKMQMEIMVPRLAVVVAVAVMEARVVVQVVLEV